MRKQLFLDTNIVLDVLARREPFYTPAARLLTIADRKKIKLFTSSLSIATSFYILSKQIGNEKAKETLRKFKILFSVLSVNEKIIDLALNSDFKDFEDAIQYHCAFENNINIIITRNIKDFKKAQTSIMTADEFLQTL